MTYAHFLVKFDHSCAIQCHFYNETCGAGNDCSGIEECPSEHHCYVLWSNSTNSTHGGPRPKLKVRKKIHNYWYTRLLRFTFDVRLHRDASLVRAGSARARKVAWTRVNYGTMNCYSVAARIISATEIIRGNQLRPHKSLKNVSKSRILTSFLLNKFCDNVMKNIL